MNFKPEYLEMLPADIESVMPDTEVWAFGSRVDGTCHSGSELDIVIRNPIDLSKPAGSKGNKLKQKLSEGNIPNAHELRHGFV